MAYARVRADVRYHSGPGGFCNVAELEFYEASMLGWTLVCVILGLGAAYVIGGSFYGQRTRAVAGTSLLAAHPHHALWVEVAGLCSDGVAFARGGGQRRGGGGGGYQSVLSAREKRHDGKRTSSLEASGKKSSGGRKKEKKEKRQKERSAEGGEGAPATVATVTSAASGGSASRTAPPAPASGTQAGDGGRWVHIPS
jgi:hypothetical protein